MLPAGTSRGRGRIRAAIGAPAIGVAARWVCPSRRCGPRRRGGCPGLGGGGGGRDGGRARADRGNRRGGRRPSRSPPAGRTAPGGSRGVPGRAARAPTPRRWTAAAHGSPHGRGLIGRATPGSSPSATRGRRDRRYGTALGVVLAAHEATPLRTLVCETARFCRAPVDGLELAREGIPYRDRRCDGRDMMASGAVSQSWWAPTDRRQRRRRQQIGPIPWRCWPARHGVPFLVAAPHQPVDLSTPSARRPWSTLGRGGSWLSLFGRPSSPAAPSGHPAFYRTPAASCRRRHRAGRAPPPYERSLRAR